MSTVQKLDAMQHRIKFTSELAAKAFANHELTQTLNDGLHRHWNCRNPKSSCYWFNVTTGPGWLLISGDVGTLFVQREPDMIKWARKAIDDLYYFASKVPIEIKTKEWDVDMAREWIADEIAGINKAFDDEWVGDEATPQAVAARKEADERIEMYSELTESLDEGGRSAFEMAYYNSELNDGSDWPDYMNYTSSYLWCREALLWFLKQVTTRPITTVQATVTKEPSE